MFESSKKAGSYSYSGEIYTVDGISVEIESEGEIYYECRLGHLGSKRTLRAVLKNKGETDSVIGKVYFIKDACLVSKDKDPDKMTAIMQRGECGRNRNVRIRDINNHDDSTIYTVLHTSGKGGLSLGFLTFDRIRCKVVFDKKDEIPGNEIFTEDVGYKTGIVLSAYCDFDDFILKSGEEIETETFFIEENQDSYRLLGSFAETVGDLYHVQPFDKVPVGWIGGWNFRDGFYRENSEKLIKENIKAINEKLAGFGIEYIWVSTVNMKDNIPGNWDLDNPYNFPEGLEKLSKRCIDNKMKLGLWFAPFWMNEASENLKEVENAIAIKKGKKVIVDKGRVTHQPFNGEKPEDLPRVYYLDPTHPDLHKFLERIFEYYNKIGISYYMIDFLAHGIDPEYNLYDKSLVNGPQSYRSAMRIIRDTVSEGTYLLSSSGPTYYNIGLVDGVRAARDFGEGRPVQKYGGFYPANYPANDFELIKEVTRDYAITNPNNKKLYINDAFNMITIQKPVPKNEARVVCSLFGLSGNPVMMGDDIPTICSERLSMLKKVLPVYDGSMTPCNLFEKHFPDTPNIFRLNIDREYGSFSIVAVFNFGEESINSKINPNIEVPEDEWIIFDFWNEHTLGTIKGVFEIPIPPHDVKVLRLTKKRKHPWIIGSDMHITQGGVEISHVHWDERDSVLKGVCHRPEGEKGRIFIYIPDDYEPVDFREMFIVREKKMDINQDGGEMIVGMKTIDFKTDTADFYIAFRKRDITRI